MKSLRFAICIVALAGLPSVPAQGRRALVPPYESADPPGEEGALDRLIAWSLAKRGLHPAPRCSDEVFIRRVYLDVVGALPAPWRVRRFLADRDAEKRSLLIDRLLADERFADRWTLEWCDLLRVKAEYPINLWPNAVQAYHRWIHDQLRWNVPYDRFARALLTTSGSNFRDPAVNFFRATQGHDPRTLGAAVALTFMGTRIEKWPGKKRAELGAFFSRLAFKHTAEWKEEIVYLDPRPAPTLKATFPDGHEVTIPAGTDPRRVFADWLTAADNPWFARSLVNRAWSWFLGRGFVDEADDLRDDNPPVHPRALDWLQLHFVDSGYDLRALFRTILDSSTYQQSPLPLAPHPEAERLFACFPVRRLEAEILVDALDRITGSGESYTSAIPEPFTFIPSRKRSVMLADGSISSPVLELFGRPSRDTGREAERSNAPSKDQRLFMINSSFIQNRIARSRRLGRLLATVGRDRVRIVEALYMNILSRRPTASEEVAAAHTFRDSGLRQALNDLVWALINSKEFLYQH